MKAAELYQNARRAYCTKGKGKAAQALFDRLIKELETKDTQTLDDEAIRMLADSYSCLFLLSNMENTYMAEKSFPYYAIYLARHEEDFEAIDCFLLTLQLSYHYKKQ